MCGISGYVMRAGRQPSRAVLERMTRALAHRGPDDQGLAELTTRDRAWALGLGHRRLSIIDLAGGHQPMAAGDETWITFNGEIYNFLELRAELQGRGHRFRTRCDTEAILHGYRAWGIDVVSRLRGMFAFALWDAPRERLLLARDRFGKKPLFLHESGDGIAFASEIKSLLCLPDLRVDVDEDAVRDYLLYRYVPGPRTLVRGVRKLLPGTLAVWHAGAVEERRYWSPPDGEPEPPRAPAPDRGEDRREDRRGDGRADPSPDPVAAFREHLDEAVAIRMVSDVPYGAFLSGGVDSAAVVALMTRHTGEPVRTFSVGFADTRYSELGHARQVAARFATEHHELVVSERELMDELPALVRFRDAPVSEPSDIPVHLLARRARESVKMVLTGEGGDELLAGYPKHAAERCARPYHALPGWLRARLIEPAVAALPYRFRRARTALASLALPDEAERWPRWFGALSRAERDRLLIPSLRGAPAATGPRALPVPPPRSRSALRRLLYFDQTSWLPDNLLERGDRMTMAASLEARMPLLDHELAAFVSGLPDRCRLRGRGGKWILRAAMRGLLPPAILARAKVGFRVPVNEWFRGPMRDYVHDHLTGSGSLTAGYFDGDALRALLAEHASGRVNHEKTIWALLNLEIWHREYLGRAPGEPAAAAQRRTA